MKKFSLILFLILVAFCVMAVAADPRYCGVENIKRNSAGKIYRSKKSIAEFRTLWACPSTGLYIQSCPGWSIDHIVPLAEGGCDVVGNMQWLPNAIKTCASSTGIPCKDRWERNVYQTVK